MNKLPINEKKILIKWLKSQPADTINKVLKDILFYKEENSNKVIVNNQIYEALLLKISGVKPDKIIADKCGFTNIQSFRKKMEEYFLKIYNYLKNNNINLTF